MQPRVYIKYDPGGLSASTLVHEAAHAKHATMPTDFSIFWANEFPITRPESDGGWRNTDLKKNGLFSHYSAFDHRIDRDFRAPFLMPRRDPEVKLGPAYLYWFEGDTPKDSHLKIIEAQIYEALVQVPVPLFAHVIPFYVDVTMPEDKGGVTFCQKLDEWYLRTAEDVACTTQQLWAASKMPYAYTAVERVAKEPIIRRKLELLVREGFLERKSEETLMERASGCKIS